MITRKNLFFSFIIFLVFSAFFLFGCQKQEEPKIPIRILWAQWAPSDYLQELSADFTKETGIPVIVEQVPWQDFQKHFFAKMVAKDSTYDLVGGDSQWIGKGAYDGYYVNISSVFNEEKVAEKMITSTVQGYCEYPAESKAYWSVPLQGDAMGIAYRKDLFENPKEKEAFKKIYNRELAIPKTWQELLDIATFFYRPSKNLYGVTVWSSNEYDGITMASDTLLWAYGGKIGDNKTKKALGILNTKESAQGIEMYRKLFLLGSKTWVGAYLDANKYFIDGQSAMVFSYFAFFPDLLDRQYSPYAEVTGFFPCPAGPGGQYTSLGGQGLSLISYSKNKEAAISFIKWFVRDDVQEEWAKLGGFSCSKKVLESEDFLNDRPYNEPLKKSLTLMKDFWNVPEYEQLLKVSQKYLFEYIVNNKITPKDALKKISLEWEEIFETNGYYKE